MNAGAGGTNAGSGVGMETGAGGVNAASADAFAARSAARRSAAAARLNPGMPMRNLRLRFGATRPDLVSST